MLTALYIEALMVDEELADQVWDLWNQEMIDDELAAIAWMLIVISSASSLCRRGQIQPIRRPPEMADRES